MSTQTFLSVSQLKTAQHCRRKRFFESVRKLPRVKTGAQAFGTLLHAVVERFLEADYQGRDKKTRQPVDLYPAGWDVLVFLTKPGTERLEEIPLCDMTEEELLRARGVQELDGWEIGLIKMLVAKAIEDGVIERRPGGKVEHPFTIPIKSLNVLFTGFIDYCTDFDVDDQKTTKNRRYLLTAEKIAADIQMMSYGAVRLIEGQSAGIALPETLTLAHNGFVKGSTPHDEMMGVKPHPPGVRRTPVIVTPAQVIDFWNKTTLPLMAVVLEDAKVDDPLKDIPHPGPGACAAYGGCPYLTICTGQESVDIFAKRMTLLKQQAEPNEQQKQELMTSLKDRLLQRMNTGSAPAAGAPVVQAPPPTAAAPAAAAAPAPTPTPEPAPAPAVDANPTRPFAPWAVPGCKPCGGTGISSAGRPCQICALKNRAEFSKFTIEPDEAGNLVWVHEDGRDGLIPVMASAPTVVKTPEVAPPAPVVETPPPAPAPAAPAPAVATIATPPAQPPAEPPKRGRGRPPGSKNKPKDGSTNAPSASGSTDIGASDSVVQGLTLLIGVCPRRSSSDVVDAESVLASLEITENGRNIPYFSYDVWKRREWLRTVAPQIAADLEDTTVVLMLRTPDAVELMAVLQAFASDILVGTN
jgi:hypothetical protein